jgi:hypothetical protein
MISLRYCVENHNSLQVVTELWHVLAMAFQPLLCMVLVMVAQPVVLIFSLPIFLAGSGSTVPALVVFTFDNVVVVGWVVVSARRALQLRWARSQNMQLLPEPATLGP